MMRPRRTICGPGVRSAAGLHGSAIAHHNLGMLAADRGDLGQARRITTRASGSRKAAMTPTSPRCAY
jgi:hypothetical protein